MRRATTRAGSSSPWRKSRISAESLAVKSAAGRPLPTTSPTAIAHRSGGLLAVVSWFVEGKEAVVIAPHVPGRLVAIPELVARHDPRSFGKQGLHDLAGEEQLLLQFVLLEQSAVQLGILDGHADLVGHRDQKVEVFLVEPAAAVPGVDLDDADRVPLLVHDRHAHERADPALARRFRCWGNSAGTSLLRMAWPLFRTRWRTDLLIESSPAGPDRVRIASGARICRLAILQQDESALGVGKDLEERGEHVLQDLAEHQGGAERLA